MGLPWQCEEAGLQDEGSRRSDWCPKNAFFGACCAGEALDGARSDRQGLRHLSRIRADPSSCNETSHRGGTTLAHPLHCPTEDVDPDAAASCCRERQLCVTWPRHSEELWPRQVWKMVSSFKIALMQRCPCSSFAKRSSMTLRIFAHQVRRHAAGMARVHRCEWRRRGVEAFLEGILRASKSNPQAKCPRVRLRTASRSLVGGLRPSSQAWESEIKGDPYVPSTKSSVFCTRMSAGCCRNSFVSNETGRRSQTEIVNGCLLN